ncbi:MAG: hypothetical protein KAF91_20685 [Nostoc sp. TH1S01]|nr:hypothetical protein [Nostoc sp. TH1S01]
MKTKTFLKTLSLTVTLAIVQVAFLSQKPQEAMAQEISHLVVDHEGCFSKNQSRPAELFKNTYTMPVTMEAVVAGWTVNKVVMSSKHNKKMIVVSITSGDTSTPTKSQPTWFGCSLEQNRRDAANSQYMKWGTLVSTNYNTVIMQRTMEDLQNIGYLGMNDLSDRNTQPLSDTITRELEETTSVAFAPENSCINFVDVKLLPACQKQNLGKTVATMPMIYDQNWSTQMTKDFSFSQSMNIPPAVSDVISKPSIQIK